MTKPRSSNEVKIWGALGASGSGKGLWIKKTLKTENPPRLAIWDAMDEYHGVATQYLTLTGLRNAMIKAGESGALKARYVPRQSAEKALRKEFEAFCNLVYAWENCCFVAEELSNVTTPSWAPHAWRRMTTSGRHANIWIIGTTQNPAMIDKAFMSNCSLLHIGMLNEYPHRQAVSRSTDIPLAQLTALLPLEFIERDRKTREVRCGKVTVPGI